ncbi:class I SAM-dependent methyltransferase [Effusibacillus pohliae]|uniref:class I SAM-dependent methyltransferase n=1 Tax=Effusibacillus pohliae TaxID=232270 RepID=UPI000381CF03|nr:SAM-dependent methyltransferase [Effusibacillus pohliae]
MNLLQKRIIEKIRLAGGRIPFADYMAEALYHPEWGYYNRPEMTIGERGDFYTSPMIHPIFGQCVARQMFRFWRQLDAPPAFTIVEMGAGTGALARDLLAEWDRLQAAAFGTGTGQPVDLRYRIVEQSPVLREMQRESTREIANGRISWHSTLPEVPGYGSLTGVVFSNELFDALPVHRLTMQDGRLQELYVTVRDAGEGAVFEEEPGQLSDEKLASVLSDEILRQLEEGDRLAVSLLAGDAIGAMADALRQGFVLTIDYGDLAPDMYRKSVRTGGIRCYRKQTLVFNPYERVGEQDITADVDFSYLQRMGEEKGLRTIWFLTQTEFLEGLGFLAKVTELQRLAFQDLRADFELQKMLTLYLPQGLGDACKVLIQRKGSCVGVDAD